MLPCQLKLPERPGRARVCCLVLNSAVLAQFVRGIWPQSVAPERGMTREGPARIGISAGRLARLGPSRAASGGEGVCVPVRYTT